MLPACTSAYAIGNFSNICLGVNILGHLPCADLNGINPLLKALRVDSPPS